MARWIGFISSLGLCYGFVPNLISPLETMVSMRAFVSAVKSTLTNELIADNPLVVDLMHGRFHLEQDVLYVVLAGVALCSKVRAEKDQNRWTTIDRYANIQKRTNMFLLIFAIALTKNIENAI